LKFEMLFKVISCLDDTIVRLLNSVLPTVHVWKPKMPTELQFAKR